MEFDEKRQNDPKYLKQYYQSRIDHWKDIPKGEKVVKHYQKSIKNLTQQSNP